MPFLMSTSNNMNAVGPMMNPLASTSASAASAFMNPFLTSLTSKPLNDYFFTMGRLNGFNGFGRMNGFPFNPMDKEALANTQSGSFLNTTSDAGMSTISELSEFPFPLNLEMMPKPDIFFFPTNTNAAPNRPLPHLFNQNLKNLQKSPQKLKTYKE